MIRFENVGLASPEQMELIIEGMRNPMNSWEKSDSYAGHEYMGTGNEYFKLGENDHSLMSRVMLFNLSYIHILPTNFRISNSIDSFQITIHKCIPDISSHTVFK